MHHKPVQKKVREGLPALVFTPLPWLSPFGPVESGISTGQAKDNPFCCALPIRLTDAKSYLQTNGHIVAQRLAITVDHLSAGPSTLIRRAHAACPIGGGGGGGRHAGARACTLGRAACVFAAAVPHVLTCVASHASVRRARRRLAAFFPTSTCGGGKDTLLPDWG
jgi:hypothetical protein